MSTKKDRGLPVSLRTGPNGDGPRFVNESPLALEPYAAQLKGGFVEAVIKGGPVPVSGEEAIRALEVSLAARQSAETGEVVWIGGKAND